MIRNDREYRETAERIHQGREHLVQMQGELEALSLTPEQVKRVLDPMRSFLMQLEEENAAI